MTERVIFQKKAIPIEVEAGKTYYWCACGRTQNQPFCDGSHKGTDISPVPYKAEATGKAFSAAAATQRMNRFAMELIKNCKPSKCLIFY